MRKGGEALERDRLRQRMAGAHHADEAIVKQRLQADFRPHGADDADIDIDTPLPQGLDILLVLMGEPQPHLGRLGGGE